MSAAIPEESEADSKSDPESGMIVGSDTLLAVDPKKVERLGQQDVVAQMFQDLQDEKTPHDWSEETSTDRVLNQLNYKNFPALHQALTKLTVKGKDKKIDVLLCARITAMSGTLNLYLDPEVSYSWRQASLVVSRSQGHGVYHA